jgi:hypothetical protein
MASQTRVHEKKRARASSENTRLEGRVECPSRARARETIAASPSVHQNSLE